MGSLQHVFEWFYVYGAIAPTTGERFFLELPYLNADTFQLFVDAFAEAFPDSLNILLLDNSGAHTARHIRWPAHVRCVWLPPYCPELNPIERFWRDLKDDLAWLQFTNLDAQQARWVRDGRNIVIAASDAERMRAYGPDGAFLALLSRAGELWKPDKVFEWNE